jgi:hypothetical protein
MQRKAAPIPATYIKECFELRADGVLIWKKRPLSHYKCLRLALANDKWAGRPAGRLNQSGYWITSITYQGKQRKVQNHRIIWLLAHGDWPKQVIDHINRIKTDNRLSNLRDVDLSTNARNKLINTKSEAVGVYRKRNSYIAQKGIAGKSVYLGSFKTIAEASAAFQSA